MNPLHKTIRHSWLVLLFCLQAVLTLSAQNTVTRKLIANDLNGYNFMIANDLGRNGYFDQKPIAAAMGEWAGKADIDFVAAAGDIHHFNGVASVNDPLWMTNYELIYTHPELMLDWYPICGNHEYRGNTQAVLDYTKISRRWVMPSRYYTMAKNAGEANSIRLIFIDTTPMMDKYRNDPEGYPDAVGQDYKAQLRYIDSVLTVSTEKWKIVIGHHPIYAYTKKEDSERSDMQARLDPILRKHNVDFYVCGHIHNFQHIRQKNSPVDYIVNSSGSGARPVQAIAGTQFCSDKSGFALCSVTEQKLALYFMDAKGECIYSIGRNKSK